MPIRARVSIDGRSHRSRNAGHGFQAAQPVIDANNPPAPATRRQPRRARLRPRDRSSSRPDAARYHRSPDRKQSGWCHRRSRCKRVRSPATMRKASAKASSTPPATKTSAGPPIPKRVCWLSSAPSETDTLGILASRSMVSFGTVILSNYRGVFRANCFCWFSAGDGPVLP